MGQPRIGRVFNVTHHTQHLESLIHSDDPSPAVMDSTE
jgi:hypothetical protein